MTNPVNNLPSASNERPQDENSEGQDTVPTEDVARSQESPVQTQEIHHSPAQSILGQPYSVQPIPGQPTVGHPYQWPMFQYNPWLFGPNQNASSPGVQPTGSLPTASGASATGGSGGTNSGPTNAGYGSGSYPGMGANPYPNFSPGFLPFPGSIFTGRPESGDPLFVSTADGPELKLISQQLTGHENYSRWSQEFRRALVTKDKDGFIDGTIPVPSDERLARHWRKCNQLVRTWIGNCISPEVAAGLPPTEDAQRMWENIKEMYGKLDRVKIFSLMQELSDLKQGNMTVTACFNKLSSLWNELEAVEEKLEGPDSTLQQYRSIKEREKATRFLLILNDTYLTFRSQILAMDPVPPIGRIYQLAVQEESQRLASPEHARHGDSIALAARGERRDEIGRAHV